MTGQRQWWHEQPLWGNDHLGWDWMAIKIWPCKDLWEKVARKGESKGKGFSIVTSSGQQGQKEPSFFPAPRSSIHSVNTILGLVPFMLPSSSLVGESVALSHFLLRVKTIFLRSFRQISPWIVLFTMRSCASSWTMSSAKGRGLALHPSIWPIPRATVNSPNCIASPECRLSGMSVGCHPQCSLHQ